MTIGGLSTLAGVTDRISFWMGYANDPAIPKDQVFSTAVAELRCRAIVRGTLQPLLSIRRRNAERSRPHELRQPRSHA